jgi:hypothetical protein
LVSFLFQVLIRGSTALRAVCHAYGSQPLGINTRNETMLRFARFAVADQDCDWSVIKERFVHRLSGLGAAHMLGQKTFHIGWLQPVVPVLGVAGRRRATACPNPSKPPKKGVAKKQPAGTEKGRAGITTTTTTTSTTTTTTALLSRL